MFSQIIEQWQQKNKWYKFGSHTWCCKAHPTAHTYVLPEKGPGIKMKREKKCFHRGQVCEICSTNVHFSRNANKWKAGYLKFFVGLKKLEEWNDVCFAHKTKPWFWRIFPQFPTKKTVFGCFLIVIFLADHSQPLAPTWWLFLCVKSWR